MVPTERPSSTRPVYPEAARGPMALPIVLLKDKNQDLSHEQCLQASFEHMAALMEQSISGEWDRSWQDPWDSWKVGKFRKIVKRANPQRFAGLAEDPESIHSTIQLGDELVELLSFAPYYLSDPDPRVKPLQVAGLDYEQRGRFPLDNQSRGIVGKELGKPHEGIVLAYDGKLGASTGKMMAQAAHGAQMLSLLDPSRKLRSESLQVVEGFDAPGVEWLVSVVDAGFTEVAPNSNTVKVGQFAA